MKIVYASRIPPRHMSASGQELVAKISASNNENASKPGKAVPKNTLLTGCAVSSQITDFSWEVPLHCITYLSKNIGLTIFLSTWIQRSQNSPQILWKCSQEPPKSSPNPSKIDPRWQRKRYWGLCWAPRRKILNCSLPNGGPETPKSLQKRLK